MALVFGRLDLRRGGDESLGETRTSSLTFTSPRPASVPRKNSTRSSLPALGGGAAEGERGSRVSDLRKRGEAERRMTHPRRTPCAAASVRPRRGTSRASTRALPRRTPRSTPRCLPRLSPPSRRVKSSPPVRVFSFQPAPAQQCISFSARDCRGENASPSSRSRFFRCFATHPRPVEGAIFSTALFAAKGPKDDNRAKWPFITPERTVVALENPIYILRWSCRFAQHAARSTRRPASSPFPTRRSRRRGVLGSNTPPCRSDSVPSVPSPARPRGASFALFRVVNGYRIGTLRCRSTPGFARLGRFPATRERAWAFLVRKHQEPALHRR